MKFLCGNCKAKYQIADEKVSGRTLRMKCRRCGHDILIDGHAMTPSMPPAAAPAPAARKPGAASVVPAPPPRSDAQPRAQAAAAAPPPSRSAGGSGRSRPPSGLSQDFRRHIAAPPEVPQRSAPYDLWHVAIQDVPVGPMTRDELARKVESGAVTGDSLCWREGMDDWRPMSELAELSQLLRRARDGSWSGRPPPRQRREASAPPRAPDADFLEDDAIEPTRAAPMPPAPVFSAPKPAALREASLPMPTFAAKAPFGAVGPQAGPPGSGAQPLLQPAPVIAAEQSAVGLPPVAPLPQPAQPAQPKLSAGLTTGIAVGLVAGILLVGGPILYRNTWGNSGAPVAQPIAPVTPAVVKPEPAREPELVIDVPDPTATAPEPEKLPTKPSGGATAGAAGRGTKTEPKDDPTAKLSDAERKLLERMGGGGSSGPSLEGQSRSGGSREDAPSGPALTAAQLTGVVQNNKTQLQRCYETALRASGGKQDGAIKITVNVTVGGSGSVKGVVTQGNGPSSMNDCLKMSVKRWRFPQSGGDSEFAFPLVFQPGA